MSDLLKDGWARASDAEAQRLVERVLADPRARVRAFSRTFRNRSAIALLAACLVGGFLGFTFPNVARPIIGTARGGGGLRAFLDEGSSP